MNLLSAVEAALACGLIVLVALELSGSLLAGVAAAILFAGSYTFWSQATIAEVYALHLLLVALTLFLVLRWSSEPTFRRLCAFLAVFGLAFGNHLSTILLLPAYTVFVHASAPGGWRSLCSRDASSWRRWDSPRWARFSTYGISRRCGARSFRPPASETPSAPSGST